MFHPAGGQIVQWYVGRLSSNVGRPYTLRGRSKFRLGQLNYPLGVMVITGRIISSKEMPPCWKLFLYSFSYSLYLVGYTK